MLRKLAVGCGVVLALFVGIIAFLIYDLQKPDPKLAVAAQRPTPQETQQAEETAQSVKKQFERPSPRTPSDPASFEVTLTENEVNQLLCSHSDIRPQLDRNGIEGLRLEFRPGEVQVTARVPAGPIKPRVEVSGTLTAENGVLQYRTKQAKVGSLGAPEQARAEIDKSLRDAFEKLGDEGRVHIREVELSTGQLVLRGEKKVGG